MGIFPRRNATTTARLFTPLANYLSQALGREVRLVTSKNFTTFWASVRQQKYDIVHYNQYHYIKSDDLYDVIACNEEFGRKRIAGALYVRRDSNIHHITDLKNKKIVFGGGKKAMMSYIVPRYLLLKAGLKKNDFITEFSKNPPNALLAIYYQQADAAGAGDVVKDLLMIRNAINTHDLRFLARSRSLFHLPWTLKRTLSPALRQRIQALFLELHRHPLGRTVLKTAKLNRFNRAESRDYDAHRTIINAVEAADE